MALKNNRASLLCYFKFCAWFQFKLELQSGNTQFKSKSSIFVSCDLEIWRMTSKNSRAHLISYFKLIRSHLQTGVAVWKCQTGAKVVLICVTLTFDIWSWPFAWTSLLSMVRTPENFTMVRWQEIVWKWYDRRRERQAFRRTGGRKCS